MNTSHINNSKNIVKLWSLTIIILLIIMIVVGGLTRLTDSGLSITKWDLFSGILPPLNNADWIKYFALYKEIPQYKLMNFSMTLSEFKFIFFWEYIHRLLGRLIGLSLLFPLLYFSLKQMLPYKYLKKFTIVFGLILLQGFVGWYMVKSGLVNEVTVSHYRLALHLTIAFIILSSLVWIYLNINSNKYKIFFNFHKRTFLIQLLIFLLFLQIVIGAYVSGLDAGRIYQTWPLMNENFFPSDMTWEDLFNFNNQSFVQFFHRNLAYLIFFLTIYIGYTIYTKNRSLITPYIYLASAVSIQIFLGIITLISSLNLYVALMHQFSSIFLISVSLNLYFRSIK
jgi:cytochrome c oxidase assembly protein subunit 15